MVREREEGREGGREGGRKKGGQAGREGRQAGSLRVGPVMGLRVGGGGE